MTRRARCPECNLVMDLEGDETPPIETFPEHLTDGPKGLRSCTGGTWLIEDEDRLP